MHAGWISEKTLRYIVSKRAPKDPKVVSEQTGVSVSHIYKIRSCYRKTGKLPDRKNAGRPKEKRDPKTADAVLAAHNDGPSGVVRLTKRMRLTKQKISYYETYRVLSDAGRIEKSGAKSRQRKWIRYERRYSNAMWHVDWHEMKNPCLQGRRFVAYLDDASRCITGFGVFDNATAENSIAVLRKAVAEFGTPGQVLSDHGVQFTANHKVRTGRKRKLTAFERELESRGIDHILARVNHPQTNCKLERFFHTLETEMVHFPSVADFIGYYNERRLHFSLDIDSGETPLLAFRCKRADKSTRASNPTWMQADA